MLVRVIDGSLKPKDKIKFMATGAEHLCEQVGVFTPKSVQRPSLNAGEVGFVIAGIKELKSAKVGDTITLVSKPATERCLASRTCSPRCSPACTRWKATITKRCATRWKNCS